MSSKEADEERVMYSEISNIEIMINDKTNGTFFDHFFPGIKLGWKHQ